MIVCNTHRFIFLKTSKTAGTSVEIALSRHCSAGDIVTPVTPRDERVRHEAGGRGPMGYAAPIGEHSAGDLWRLITRGRRRRRFYNHMPAAEARTRLPAGVWDRAFKFCVARNPWDRAVSYYYHKYKSQPRPTISRFLSVPVLDKLRREGPGVYMIDGVVAVDRVCRYESLGDELAGVWRAVGLPGAPDLPRAKGGHRPTNAHYSEILTPADRDLIARVFADEIEFMGYQFETAGERAEV